jgi:LPXTG-motif cell wall-anchored protein
VGQRDEAGNITFRKPGYYANHRLLTANPGFRTYDENTVWASHTDVEIFRISYKNGSGQVTVNSSNGDKLLAPGTTNRYQFALENTGNVALDYTLSMEAYFSHQDHPIPIYARVVDYKGNYLLGTAENTVDVLGLNDVQKSGSLTAGYIAPYTLEWEWPFELDDQYDTMLGNMAVDEDITLTIVIKTTASYSEKPDTEAGLPQTGDDTNILLLTGLMVASGAALLFLVIFRPKQEEENA